MISRFYQNPDIFSIPAEIFYVIKNLTSHVPDMMY